MEREIGLDQLLAYLGAEYVHRMELEEENAGLREKVEELQTALGQMAEKLRDQTAATNNTVTEA